MNGLLVIALTLSVVSADIGLKLREQKSYNQIPQTSYGVPTYQVTSNYNSGYPASSGSGYNYAKPSNQGSVGQNTGYQTGFQSVGGSSNYQSGVSGIPVSQPSYQFGGASQGGYQTFNQYENSNQYQSSSVHKYQEHYNQVQQQPAQIFKHFYVHAAPEEPEVPRPRQPITLPPPQKHYKIIFIKAPTQTVYAPKYIPVPQQNEEKTIVYVLVNKPEEQPDITIPKIEPKAPSKPEVFFIKYNNKDDSQAVINNIVTDYTNKGESVNFNGVDAGATTATQNVGTGQYNQFAQTGQYAQGGSGQYTQSSAGTEQYTGSSSGSSFGGQSFSSFGSSSAGASSSTDSSPASVANTASTSGITSGSISSTSSANYGGSNIISTSQGVPHESYGPPTFRG